MASYQRAKKVFSHIDRAAGLEDTLELRSMAVKLELAQVYARVVLTKATQSTDRPPE